MENGNGRLSNIKRFLYTIYDLKNRTEVEEKTIDGILSHLPWASGGLFIRNVESTGLLYYTVKRGIFNDFPILYGYKKDTVVEYVLETGKPCIVNSFREIPCEKSFLPFLPYLDMGYKLVIIPIRDTKNVLPPQMRPGVIVIAHKDKDFTEEDLTPLLNIVEEYRNLLYFYLAAIYCKKREQVINISINMLNNSLSRQFHPTGNILESYLRDVVSIIDGAQRASLLVNTPIGMKFLAVYGYDKNKLLSLPPLSQEEELRWYHIGEDKMRSGVPRIITDKEISVLSKISTIGQTEPQTSQMKSNLAIPVAVDGELLMLLNLDNFETPIAFDDMDIMIAQHMAIYLASSYELITRQKKINRQEVLLAHLTMFAETLTDEQYVGNILKKTRGITPKKLFDLFKSIVNNAIMTFHPYITKFAYAEDGTFLQKQLEDIPEELRDAIEIAIDEVQDKNYVIKSYKEFHIIAVHKVWWLGDKRYHLYILSVRKNDVWTNSDVRYILSAANSAMLFVKNLKYLSDIKEMQKETMLMLGKALEFRDMETKGHTERTAYYTERLAKALGFKDMEGIIWGAYLHDIGKIAIPDYILLKPGRLTKEEFEIMKKHVIYGYQLVKGIKGIPETTLNVIRYHHEKWNGTGYLEGLKGEDIPFEARIFAIVDVFDALTSPRPYKEPWPVEKALNLIENEAGKHFDPDVADVFIDLIRHKHLLEDFASLHPHD